MICKIFNRLHGSAVCITALLMMLMIIPACRQQESKPEKPEDLIQSINAVWEPLGLKIEADETVVADDTSAGSGKKQQYLVTLKNPIITVNISSLKNLNASVKFKGKKLPLSMKKMVMRYDPDKKHLSLLSCKGLNMKWDFSQDVESKGKKKMMNMYLELGVGKMDFDHYDVSSLLETKTRNPIGLIGELFKKNPSIKSEAENVHYELTLPAGGDGSMVLRIDFGKLAGRQSVQPEAFFAIYNKQEDVALPDFKQLLERGIPVFDFEAKGTDLKVTYNIAGAQLVKGNIKDANIFYFLKPDKHRSCFQYGGNFAINSLQVDLPGLKEFPKLAHLEKLGIEGALVNLSPEFIRAYFEMLRKSSQLSTTGKSQKEIQKHRLALSMKIFMELLKSNPQIKLKVSPFKHALIELAAWGKFHVSGARIPTGKAVVTIDDLSGVYEKLKSGNIVPPFVSKFILELLEKYVVTCSEGKGSFTFMTKESAPGQLFINGKPIRE